jgi:hypothetical protein
LKEALVRLDVNVEEWPLSIPRLYWIRGEVVHRGREFPDDLEQGYYLLEAIVRILLREEVGDEGLWPLLPDPDAFRSPVREQIIQAWNSPPIVNLE